MSAYFTCVTRYESLAGTKFDVPDVSTLAPIPDNELARSAVSNLVADSKAMRRGMVDAFAM